MAASEIHKIAVKLGTDGPVKVLPTPRKVQLLYGGVYLVRTINAMYAWEHPYYPQYYVPKKEFLAINDVPSVKLEAGDKIHAADGKHVATQYTIHAPQGKSTSEVILFADDLSGSAAPLAGLAKIDFGAMDQWFEEDAPIHVHPKDPFKRIDILPSTRHIKVSVAGHAIAETRASMHLFETGLPRRFYLPLTSVDARVLRPSSTTTQCPYKGQAEYFDVEVGGERYENLLWYYTRPTLESSKVEGLVCPYNERVDIELDGEPLERPDTHFGRSKDVNVKPSVL